MESRTVWLGKYHTTLLLRVTVIAQRMFHAAKYSHSHIHADHKTENLCYNTNNINRQTITTKQTNRQNKSKEQQEQQTESTGLVGRNCLVGKYINSTLVSPLKIIIITMMEIAEEEEEEYNNETIKTRRTVMNFSGASRNESMTLVDNDGQENCCCA